MTTQGRLHGQVAIVTGAARGIGRAIALHFAREGAQVSLADVQDGGGQRTRDEIVAHYADAAASQQTIARCQICDVSVAADVQQLVAETEAAMGPVSILVNNAASYRHGTAVDIQLEDWDLARRTIYDAAFLGARFAIPSMQRAGKGAIITIASVHGLVAARNSVAYEAAKGAVILLTKQLAVDYGPDGIRANCICPGLIVTEVFRPRLEEDPRRAQRAAQVYPLRRYGHPDDIAQAAVFLASDESSFITGHALVVDGGLTVQLQDDLASRMMAYATEEAAPRMS
jgi:NAD(P)-dependent dehydrogenase (short-subunit alcohol dehydrogenase family)